MTEQHNCRSVLLQYIAAPSDAICLAKEGILSKQTIVASLQQHFLFPDYFGGNVDAAYDLLLDVVDTLTEPTVWRFCNGSQVKTDHDALANWQQLMQDVMQYAQSKGIKLQVELFIEP